MDENSLEAVREAERIIWAAGWRFQEEAVLARLAGTVGLARARFEPRSESLQLVAFDGEHLTCAGRRILATAAVGGRAEA